MMRPRDERGFVLSMVIFAVAALSIAGTAMFLVVQSENAMASSGAESSSAFHLANAGLSRYMGESFGRPDTSVVYEMGGGVVNVTATRVMPLGDTAEVYLVRAEAQIRDRRVEGLVLRRTVQQFATLRNRPFTPNAGVMLGSTNARTRSVELDGRDQCGVEGGIAGIASIGSADFRGTLNGSPNVRSMTYSDMLHALDIDWAALRDPSFPFDYEVGNAWGLGWPPFYSGALPADVYPTIRVDGDLRAWAALSGRGLLVVTGDVQFHEGFSWDGAIIAGGMKDSNGRDNGFTINGVLITGLNGVQNRVELQNGTVRYNSCNTVKAGRGIAMFSPMSNTWWESAN